MNKPNLLILSGLYPFQGGEPFLHLEAAVLSRYFNVFILPCCVKDIQQVRDLPDNTCLLKAEAKEITRKKGSVFALAGACVLSFPYLMDERRKNLLKFLHPYGFARACWRAVRGQIIAPVIRKICEDRKIDVIYSYWMSYEALAAIIAAKRYGLKTTTLTRAHGHDLYEYANSPAYCPFQEYIFRNVGHVVTVSRDGAKYLRDKYESCGDRVSTFRLGVTAGEKAKASTDGVFRIVSCSSLKPIKRVHLIAEALRFVDFPLLWTHIGGGPEISRVNGEARKTLGENANVSIALPGNMDNEDVLKFYEANPVDLFVNISASEGIPVSIMEAFSRGIPAIATDVGGVSEIISENPGSGWLLSADISPKELGDQISETRASKALLPAREKAFLTWKKFFNGEKNYDDFAKWMLKISAKTE